MNKTAIFTLLAMCLILAAAGAVTYYFYATPNDDSNSDAKRAFALGEGLSFSDLDGNPVTFDQYEGKVRIVNSWASWSPFSVQELPLLEQLAEEYGDQEVVVIAINRKESKEKAQSFLNSLQQFDSVIFAIDPADSFYNSLDGFSMPETIFFDARGNLVFHKHGQMTLDEMKMHTQKALESAS